MAVPRGVMLSEARAPKDPATMTAGQINKELDKLDKLSSKLTDEFIAAGRGRERPSEIIHMTDPLAVRQQELWDRYRAPRIEIKQRYGPGDPSRLPSGFKRRR